MNQGARHTRFQQVVRSHKRAVLAIVLAASLVTVPTAHAATAQPSLKLLRTSTGLVIASFRHFPESAPLMVSATVGTQSNRIETVTTSTGRSAVSISVAQSLLNSQSLVVTGSSGSVTRRATLSGLTSATQTTVTPVTSQAPNPSDASNNSDKSSSTDTSSQTDDFTDPGHSARATTSARSDLSDPAKKEVAMQLVASAENSSLDWKAQYGYIEDIGDGRGYTAGIIGFCTGCGDLLKLVERYTQTSSNNVLAKYLPALREKGSMDDSHDGLDPNFVSDWKQAAQDPAFRAAQDAERDRVYFDPSVEQAKADGLRALGQFIYYDAIVMHGPGSDSVSFGGIRQTALENAKPPSQGGDEVAYLNAFLDARVAAMKTEAAHDDTTRVDTAQRRFLEAGNLDLNTPLSFSVYGESFEIK